MSKQPNFKGIKNPAQLLAFFDEYREWVADNPLCTTEQKRGSVTLKFDRGGDHEALKDDLKDAINNPLVHIPRRRPLYIVGFMSFMYRTYGIKAAIDHIMYNRDNKYQKYVPAVELIKSICEDDVTEGAAVDGYNTTVFKHIVDNQRSIQQKNVDANPENVTSGIVINFNTVTPLPLDEDADLDETAGAEPEDD